MRSVRVSFELIFVTVLAGFAANIVPSLVGRFLSLIRLGGLRRCAGGKPSENGEKQAADQQRSNGFVRRQLSASVCRAQMPGPVDAKSTATLLGPFLTGNTKLNVLPLFWSVRQHT